MSVVVVATIRPLPGRRDEAIAIMAETIARVHAEDEGCELYALHEGEDFLMMVEKWASRELLDAHLAGPAIAALQEKTKGVTDPPDIAVLRPHPAGTAGQGAI